MSKKHIALITDDNYCFPTLVCIKSLINNTVDYSDYVIHVCTFGLDDANVTKLRSLSTRNVDVVIDLFNGAQYEEKLKQISQKTHVTPTALIKFELPNYFSELDTLLYLDGDIIIKNKIDALLERRLGDAYLAGSYDFHSRLNKINYSFKRDYEDFYFNSGVMLLNLEVMRKDDITEKLWYYKIHHAKTRLMDQESLNAVCGHDAVPLSLVWNFNPVFFNEKYLAEINNVYKTSFKDVKELEDSVNIIHYVGKPDKPWIYKDATFRQYWDRALDSYDDSIKLQLKTFERITPSFIESSKSKISLFGVKGFLCFLINRLRKRALV